MAHGAEDRGPILLGINAAAMSLAVISCALRCYVRVFMLRGFGWDDWLMAGSTATFVLYCAFSISGVQYGTGHHKSDLSPENYSAAMKWWFCCYLAYSATMILVKFSIGWFLLRVTISRLHRWIIYLAVIVTCVSCLCFIFVCVFQCNPISYYWDKHTQTGTCIDIEIVIGLSYLYSALSVASDFTFALLPAWVVSHLKMKKSIKAALIALMGLGCIASAAVVVRWPYMRELGSDDFLWDSLPIAIWSTVEQCLAITAGCLATLQPLVKLARVKLGIATYPGLGTSSNLRMNGEISIRRSFTRRTEPFPLERDPPSLEEGLKLQPGFSGYSAKCYNTSQEELAPARTGTSRSNSYSRKGSKGDVISVSKNTDTS